VTGTLLGVWAHPDDVTPRLVAGEMLAIAGRSGAGKTTLLEAMATRHESEGRVAYVPQDDIVHRDLPARSVLRHAARLRRPGWTRAEVDARVDEILAVLGLRDHAGQRVATLSGGERKRVSIGVELLDRPQAIFLDEPTSGLDPATAASLLRTLRQLADHGTAIALTTHSTDDLHHCDRLVFVVPGGSIAYDGPVCDAGAHFGVTRLAGIYEAVEEMATAGGRSATSKRGALRIPYTSGRDSLRQIRALVARNVDVLVHNRMSTAIMLGAPALVIAMFVVLFQAGAVERDGPGSAAASMTAFWLSFASFFFGLTFGLLQVVTEVPLVRRERFAGVRIRDYLIAKFVVLVPVLLLVIVTMVGVLTAFDRLPDMSIGQSVELVATLLLGGIAALALGLLASSLVRDASQATLALPMLCFPAVLFSGGVLSVHDMPIVGRAISAVTTNRWAFDAVTRDLQVHGSASSTATALAVLVASTSLFVAASVCAVGARTKDGLDSRR
jgi:ABC-type multidrug transport system ATPase subunit